MTEGVEQTSEKRDTLRMFDESYDSHCRPAAQRSTQIRHLGDQRPKAIARVTLRAQRVPRNLPMIREEVVEAPPDSSVLVRLPRNPDGAHWSERETMLPPVLFHEISL